MTHVVAHPCLGCLTKACVDVCPEGCFRQGLGMVYIEPHMCTDCEACVPACSCRAIYREDQLPARWLPFRDLNATMARQCPVARRCTIENP